MDYLARESAPFSGEIWNQIDETVVNSARAVLTGRKFINLYGPLGAQELSVPVDDLSRETAVEEDGLMTRTAGRAYKELPLIYSDATLYWRDMENSLKNGRPLDLSAVMNAVNSCAKKEDELIFFGNKTLGYDGLFTAANATHLKRSDWKTGENPFSDIAKGIEALVSKGIWGRMSLVVSPNLYSQLQRIQPGTGRMEVDRVSTLVDGRLFRTPVLGENKAILLCSEAQYMDLAIGQDLAASYLELKDLNHVLRIIETVLPRIKRGDAIVVFD